MKIPSRVSPTSNNFEAQPKEWLKYHPQKNNSLIKEVTELLFKIIAKPLKKEKR